jgi:hypothetical protein
VTQDATVDEQRLVVDEEVDDHKRAKVGLPPCGPDEAVAHRCKREQHRERQRRYRARLKFYGKPGVGYRVTFRVMSSADEERFALRYQPIAAALETGDAEEIGRMFDALEAALAIGELGAFEEDPSGYAP